MLKREECPKEEIGITRDSQKQNISKLGVKVIFANLPPLSFLLTSLVIIMGCELLW